MRLDCSCEVRAVKRQKIDIDFWRHSTQLNTTPSYREIKMDGTEDKNKIELAVLLFKEVINLSTSTSNTSSSTSSSSTTTGAANNVNNVVLTRALPLARNNRAKENFR